MCRDKASSDEFLGHAAVDLATMTQILGNQGQQGNTANTSSLAPNTVRWHNKHLRTIHSTLMNVLRRVVAKLQPVSWRPSKYRAVSGEAELELLWRPLSPAVPPRPGPAPAAPLQLLATRAVLSVFLYSANNLAAYTGPGAAVPLPAGYLPSPQVAASQDVMLLLFYCFDRQRCRLDQGNRNLELSRNLNKLSLTKDFILNLETHGKVRP